MIELETAVGPKLAERARKQLNGWFRVTSGVIQLTGYGIYLDLASVEADFAVSAKQPKPRLKDIRLGPVAIRNALEWAGGENRDFRNRVRFERKQTFEMRTSSWKSDQACRAEEKKNLVAVKRQFRKNGILVVVTDLRDHLPVVRVGRESYGGIH
ncbi:hypothetical protein HY629_02100 [Candidatus Uhrbacteria bacterium]|nr:hypothetical protein [Candidatus Uhrbacteria bacterium]